MTYQRNRRFSGEDSKSAAAPIRNSQNAGLMGQSAHGSTQANGEPQKGIRIDGKQQVFELLLAADPAFRESLLRKIATGDRLLAEQLRRRLEERLSD